jgi:hypothetical protein
LGITVLGICRVIQREPGVSAIAIAIPTLKLVVFPSARVLSRLRLVLQKTDISGA